MSAETPKNMTISVVVDDTVSVLDVVIVVIITARLTTWSVPKKSGTVVSVAEYRQLRDDYTSTDERITERLQYLEAFCRNIIKPELQKTYDKSKEVTIR